MVGGGSGTHLKAKAHRSATITDAGNAAGVRPESRVANREESSHLNEKHFLGT